MSSILDALKKAQQEQEKKEPGPFNWPDPVDTRVTLGNRLKKKEARSSLNRAALLLLFAFILLSSCIIIFLKKEPIPVQPEKKESLAAPLPVKEKPAVKMVVEKTDKGIKTYLAAEPPETGKLKEKKKPPEKPENEAFGQVETGLKQAPPDWLKLHGISWSSDPEKRMAVINATIAVEGKVVDGARIVRIEKRRVLIEKDGETMILSFDRY